ncbi:MAG: hypothetical protein ACYDC0_15235 [Acidimicrobiales bacterium]
MALYDDCSHYVRQTVRGTERLERCRLGANETLPFACPEGCVFYERRRTSSAGWKVRRPDHWDPGQGGVEGA